MKHEFNWSHNNSDGTLTTIYYTYANEFRRDKLFINGVETFMPNSYTMNYNGGFDMPLNIDGKEYILARRGKIVDISFNGIYQTSGMSYEPLVKPPKWMMVFPILCIIAPIIALGGALPILIGFAAAAVCGAVARSQQLAKIAKVFIASVTTIACWGLIAGLIFTGFLTSNFFNSITTKTYTENGFSIEATGDFSKVSTSITGYTIDLQKNDARFYAFNDNNSDVETQMVTKSAKGYAEFINNINGITGVTIIEDSIYKARYEYTYTENDNTFYEYNIILKGQDSYWFCSFLCEESDKDKYEPKFTKWGDTIVIPDPIEINPTLYIPVSANAI